MRSGGSGRHPGAPGPAISHRAMSPEYACRRSRVPPMCHSMRQSFVKRAQTSTVRVRRVGGFGSCVTDNGAPLPRMVQGWHVGTHRRAANHGGAPKGGSPRRTLRRHRRCTLGTRRALCEQENARRAPDETAGRHHCELTADGRSQSVLPCWAHANRSPPRTTGGRNPPNRGDEPSHGLRQGIYPDRGRPLRREGREGAAGGRRPCRGGGSRHLRLCSEN